MNTKPHYHHSGFTIANICRLIPLGGIAACTAWNLGLGITYPKHIVDNAQLGATYLIHRDHIVIYLKNPFYSVGVWGSSCKQMADYRS